MNATLGMTNVIACKQRFRTRVQDSALCAHRLGVAQSVSYPTGRFTAGARQADDERRRFGWSGWMKKHGAGSRSRCGGRPLKANQFGPAIPPVVRAQRLADDLLSRLALNGNGQLGRARAKAVADVFEMPQRRSARCSKCFALFVAGEGLQEGKKTQHSGITPSGVSRCQHHSVLTAESTSRMADDALIRRANMKRLMAERSLDVKHLPGLLGSRYSYWNDLLNDPTKSFGEKVARRIEDGFNIPRGWLDQSDASLAEAAKSTAEVKSKATVDFASQVASETDWAILNAVKVMMTDAEIKDLLRRHSLVIERQEAFTAAVKNKTQISKPQLVTSSPAGTGPVLPGPVPPKGKGGKEKPRRD